MRRAAPFLAAILVVAIVVIGLLQATGGEKEKLPTFDVEAALQELRGAPAPLSRLHAQSNELLGGGVEAVRARLRELRGHPVVINKWGSWCGPCRREFPILQHASAKYGERIAFLGIDVVDPKDAAGEFLRDFPVTYPSYRDPHGGISQELGIPGGAPIMLFLDARGETAFIHHGEYKTLADLEADIDRYL